MKAIEHMSMKKKTQGESQSPYFESKISIDDPEAYRRIEEEKGNVDKAGERPYVIVVQWQNWI